MLRMSSVYKLYFFALFLVSGCSNQSLNSVQLGLREVSFEVSQEGSQSGIIRAIKSSQIAPLKVSCPAGSAKLQARYSSSSWIDVAEMQCQGGSLVDTSIDIQDLKSRIALEGFTFAPPDIQIELKITSSTAESKVQTIRIIETSVLPSETTIFLSGGASVTNSSIVSLTSTAVFRGEGWLAAPQSVYITSQSGCAAGGVWQPYFSLIPVVPLDHLDQINTKYVAFKDDLGNVSDCFQASILHDGTAPQLESVLIDSGAAQTDSGFINIEISASGTDLDEMAIFPNSNCSGTLQWQSFVSSISAQVTSNGTHYVSARVRDVAGNVSGCVSDAIIFDNQPPEVPTALALANSLASTDNESSIGVRVLGVIDGDTALVYSDSSCSTLLGSATAISNEATVSVTLASDGLYSFFARARDPQNRQSACTSTSVTYVLDRVGPSVLRVTSSQANGDYATGSTIPVQIVFSDPVVVTGNPTLALDLNGTSSLATYSSGSGSATLTFQFTVASWMTEDDLNYASSTSLSLPVGASIMDLIGNAAVLTLPATNSANALAQQKDIKINFAVYLTQA
jgi:hypothetical protein